MERRLTIRVSDEELAAWKDRAWREKMSLSAWVRLKLEGGPIETGYRQVMEKDPVSPPRPPPVEQAPAIRPLAGGSKPPGAQTPGPTERCPMQTPKGVKCKFCGKMH